MKALLIAITACAAYAALIPSGRTIDWSNSGVPGGIPNRTMVFRTIDTGGADASAAINAALAACPEGQVVMLSAGFFNLNSAVTFGNRRGITLRGAGMGRTTLRPATGLNAAITTGQTGFSSERTITGGSTKGSRTITVDNAGGVAPGLMLNLYQGDDPDFYWTRSGLSGHTGQFVMVASVSGNTIQLEDPLVWDFTLNPRWRLQNQAGVRLCGLEDLTVIADSLYDGSMIQFWSAYACWIRGVETAWGNGNEHIFMTYCLRCEIRESYVHDTYSVTDGYGIVTLFGWDGYHGGCTGTRIENNMFSGLWGATILETEVGSVIGYNFTRNMRYPGWPDYMMYDYNGNHGAHGMMVLFEGNQGYGGIQQDGYHGSVSHTTYFRNYFSGKHVEPRRDYKNAKLIDLCRFSYYQNVVGNVLGAPDWPRTTIGRYEMSGTPDYTSQACIYRLGYPNMGNNGYSLTNPPSNADDGGLDPKVKSTLLRWGNFDYQNNAARWESTEIPSGAPVPADHVLPASLYLAAKPSWWCDSLAWPAIGPDVTGLANDIPAKRRYEGKSCPATSVEVSTPIRLINGPALFTVYNIRGQAVRTFKGEYNWRSFRMERNLPNGLYIWIVRQGEVKKVFKQVVIR